MEGSDPGGTAAEVQAGVIVTEPEPSSESVLSDDEVLAVAPEVLANSLGEYFRAWWQRIKNGESGVLPVLIGLIAIVVFFQLERSVFLTAGNLVNLLVQASIFIMFGAAEIFALLLSEIDLSIGYGAGVAAFVIAELIATPVNFPWWLGILGGLSVMALLGFIQGTLITRLALPSFVVTLAGSLAFLGLMLELANFDKTAVGGVMTIDASSPVAKLVASTMDPTVAWVVLVVVIAAFAALTLRRAAQRRAQGLTAPPIGVSLLIIGMTAVGGIVLVAVCNANRGQFAIPVKGVPWVVPFVIVVLMMYSWLLGRTRLGRYIYAIGANPEAARRAGISVNRVRTIGFMLVSITAGLAGLIYESTQGSIATDINGGQYVLYAVAAAVIGGTSLFGGRGKMLHALLGGIVIATVFNGLGLMGISAPGQDISTAIVLLVAVTLDSLVRRRATIR
ncbi:MAG: sugar ABC transporter permease [Solirubrobacteraceae bacterium]